MKESCQILQEIGAQKIHEDTHIARVHIQAVIHESFEDLNKVQFLGFVSIFEREYNLDLSNLKRDGLAFFEENSNPEFAKKGVFISVKQKNKPTFIYIILSLIIVVAVAYLGLSSNSGENNVVSPSVENKIIAKVKEDIKATQAVDSNLSDVNATLADLNSSVAKIVEEPKELKPFIIKAKKVWIGYIDVKNNKKYNETIKGEISLKRNKEWLLLLGHSQVKFSVNGELKTFSANGNLRLHYKDGEIKKITLKEFKKLNRGRKW